MSLVLAQGGPSPLPAIELPAGSGGVGFDDLRYAEDLERVLVPGGQTGLLFLLDPGTGEVTTIGGFEGAQAYRGGHGEGVTSADFGGGMLYAIDRTAQQLDVIDPERGRILAGVDLAAPPDYVRYVAATSELWVTEPDAEQIEVFSAPTVDELNPVPKLIIRVAGGPESLVIDEAGGRAYTHEWAGRTVAIDLASHEIIASWRNGCEGSRGIALDEGLGLLFAGCNEGRVTAMDLSNDGEVVGEVDVGVGVDVIGYDSGLAHLYAPAQESGSMAVVGVTPSGRLEVLARVPVTQGAHCAVADGMGHAWVCDPQGGRLLRYDDTLPPVE
ncbi:MAG TPA: hypothetical protein VF168_12410 [Trueperaceae bacterium]